LTAKTIGDLAIRDGANPGTQERAAPRNKQNQSDEMKRFGRVKMRNRQFLDVKLSRVSTVFILALIALLSARPSCAQGPFAPHPGLTITRAYTSQYGPDAEEFNVITDVTRDGIALSYSDTRGITAQRLVRTADRRNAHSYLIGFDPRVPRVIPNTTSLGISSEALQQLRSSGVTAMSLMYDTRLSTISGSLTLVNDNGRLPVLVENQIVSIPVLIARGNFQNGARSASGYFYFVSDIKNPIAIEYSIRMSWEKALRTTRTVRVSAGRSEQAAMEQTLRTLRKLDVYGIHFDFDKATIRPAAKSLIADIAKTLKNNPAWTIRITGHTDAIGRPEYNLDLSSRRAEAVKQAIARNHGINPARISTAGAGSTKPKASNATLQGRAQNRRVELTRTDR
jgi:outer membrane protein OmpA-like peptidoglycan-associated protein